MYRVELKALPSGTRQRELFQFLMYRVELKAPLLSIPPYHLLQAFLMYRVELKAEIGVRH